MFEGQSLALAGLAPEHAVQVVELELGRPLRESERADAARVCAALDGHPLKVREAVATSLATRRSLSELANELSGSDPRAAVAAQKFAAAGADGRRLAAALSLFEDATVGEEHLRAIAGVENFDTSLHDALARRGLRSHSPTLHARGHSAPRCYAAG
jgi:hypothetical protein